MRRWVAFIGITTLVPVGAALAQGVGQDLKTAGRDTKAAGKSVGNATVKGGKAVGHGAKTAGTKVTHGTKSVAHSGAKETEKGATKVEQKTHP